MVQKRFSNSCALWTPCDSLKRNRESVYKRETMQDQKMGAMANKARNTSRRDYNRYDNMTQVYKEIDAHVCFDFDINTW